MNLNFKEPFYASIRSIKQKNSDRGPFWCIFTQTQQGKVEFKIFSNEEPFYMPQVGDFFKIEVLDEKKIKADYERWGSITLRGKYESNCNSEKIRLEDIPEKYREAVLNIKKASKKQLEESWSYITDESFWKDKKNYKLTMLCLSKIDKVKLSECPAASSMHHNYMGGLLVHTYEVYKACHFSLNAWEKYKYINRDVLNAGAILHDLGKVHCYYLDETQQPQSGPNEKLIGHTAFSLSLFLQTAREIEFPDKNFVDNVAHLICSHHGKLEWSAIKEPMTAEAIILHHADLQSSTFEYLQNELDSHVESNNQITKDFIKKFEKSFYVTEEMKKLVSERIDLK